MAWRVGVDIGGTFTDVALVDEATGEIGVAKVPTTPRNLAEGVLAALGIAIDRYGVEASKVGLLAHATTVVTNAILEGRGARAALITTRGFRDVLELRRSARADLYDLFQDAPATLVPRRHRYEITERIGADGAVVTPLAEREIDALIATLRAERVEALAVSLMFSFLNPDHERRLGARLRAALPGLPIYLSCEVLPEIKEFERTSTTAVCAYVGPILASYLARLEEATRSLGLPPLYVMASNGGILEAREAVAMPAVAVESGPAAGVVAAALVARQTGRGNLLSFDMGGTTAKASLIRDGQYETTPEYEVGGGSSRSRWMHGTGHPIRVSVIDLAEVSAGGGSIAWVDRAGALRVGPKSAGADPGPVCYARGGVEPTVTDCNLLLGYLDKGSLLGGRAAHRPCSRRGRDPRAPGRAAWRRSAHGRGGRHRCRQPCDGRSAQDRLRATRLRSARVRARGVRRSRSAACCRPGGRTRHRRDHLPADTGCLLGARPGRNGSQARLRAHSLCHDRKRRSRRAGAGVRRTGRARRRHARPRRRRGRQAPLRALRRCALRAPVLRAVDRGGGAQAGCSAAGRDRRDLPRPPSRHLWTRQSCRAGAACQRAPHGRRGDPAARRQGPHRAGRHQCHQERARGVVCRRRGNDRQGLRSAAHACGAGCAGTRRHRVAGVHDPRAAGLAGLHERRRFRGSGAPASGERQ